MPCHLLEAGLLLAVTDAIDPVYLSGQVPFEVHAP